MSYLLPELQELERIVGTAGSLLRSSTLCEVKDGSRTFPIQLIVLGNESREVPAIGFFGGVHGLERIGTQVLLSFLAFLVQQAQHDEALQRWLAGTRVVFVPLVNPVGMARGTRANGNGVDLMRNAPLQSRERVALLIGGHRISAALPWYRGASGAPMELEAQALCEVVRGELLSRSFSIAVDCHSGFGLRDRVWFPHAHTREPFAHLAEIHALMRRFEAAEPSHGYLFEPQSRRYVTHGDLWDYLCIDAAPRGTFLPLTLEMGSWRWIRKSPRQIFSRLGMFNPMPEDRRQRVRHNHLALLEFLCLATHGCHNWLPTGEAHTHHERTGLHLWFSG